MDEKLNYKTSLIRFPVNWDFDEFPAAYQEVEYQMLKELVDRFKYRGIKPCIYKEFIVPLMVNEPHSDAAAFVKKCLEPIEFALRYSKKNKLTLDHLLCLCRQNFPLTAKALNWLKSNPFYTSFIERKSYPSSPVVQTNIYEDLRFVLKKDASNFTEDKKEAAARGQ